MSVVSLKSLRGNKVKPSVVDRRRDSTRLVVEENDGVDALMVRNGKAVVVAAAVV